jgi:hypothetical protein
VEKTWLRLKSLSSGFIFLCVASYGENFPKHLKKPEDLASNSCIQNISPSDLELIKRFEGEVSEIRDLRDTPTFQSAVERKIKDYSQRISQSGLLALQALQLKMEVVGLEELLRSDRELAQAFLKVDEAGKALAKSRDRVQANKSSVGIALQSLSSYYGLRSAGNKTGFRRQSDYQAFNDAEESYFKSTKDFLKVLDRSSGMESFSKRQIRTSMNFQQMVQADLGRATQLHVSTIHSVAEVGSGLAAGAGGFALAYLMPVLAKEGLAMTALGSSAMTTLGSSLLASATAGAAAGGAYAVTRGQIAMMANAALSDDFFCELLTQQTQNSAKIYEDALRYSAIGASIGAGFGSLFAAAGAAASAGMAVTSAVIEGGTIAVASGLSLYGLSTSVFGASAHGQKAYELFLEAEAAAKSGALSHSRSLLRQSRSHAVEAGLSSLDGALSAVAAQQTLVATRKSFAELHRKLVAAEIENFSAKIAAELHGQWLLKYREKFGETPKYKEVPESLYHAGENSIELMSRLTRSGVSGLMIKNGKVLQNINQDVSRLLPALNWKLNGGPALDYAKIIAAEKNPQGEKDFAQLASMIHEAWMKHNLWQQKDSPGLFQPYAKLKKSEQLQDIEVLELALKLAQPLTETQRTALSRYRSSLQEP